MKQYRKRIYDTVLRHRLEAKGAVLVEGPKWCGKTTTCLQLAQSVLYMAQPDIREQNIMLTDMQPSLLLQGATPRLIDEWQIAPKLWDAVRFEVDQRDEFNQFLLRLKCAAQLYRHYPHRNRQDSSPTHEAYELV